MNDQHETQALVFKSTTVDVGKEVDWKAGNVWILSEVKPANKEQLPYCDGDIMKVLFMPSSGGTVRCHYRDCVLPPLVPWISTSSASNPQAW